MAVSARGNRIWDGVELFEGGAALLTDVSVLVVSDLHLGCEAALEYEGLSIPRVQTRKIESYLLGIIDSIGPRKLVVAGDLKHNFSRNLTQEWQDVSRFVHSLRERVPLEVIKGNHDNYLGAILSELGIPLRMEMSESGTRILHGHSGKRDNRPTIIGHIHPSIRLKDDIGASLKDRCFLFDPDIKMLILPALSLVASGLDVISDMTSDRASPLLPEKGLKAFEPVVFSGSKAMRFPQVGKLRRT